MPKLKSGVCQVCGCSDDDACEQGCGWEDIDHTLCDQCEVLGAGLAHHREADGTGVFIIDMPVFVAEVLERGPLSGRDHALALMAKRIKKRLRTGTRSVVDREQWLRSERCPSQ